MVSEKNARPGTDGEDPAPHDIEAAMSRALAPVVARASAVGVGDEAERDAEAGDGNANPEAAETATFSNDKKEEPGPARDGAVEPGADDDKSGSETIILAGPPADLGAGVDDGPRGKSEPDKPESPDTGPDTQSRSEAVAAALAEKRSEETATEPRPPEPAAVAATAATSDEPEATSDEPEPEAPSGASAAEPERVTPEPASTQRSELVADAPEAHEPRPLAAKEADRPADQPADAPNDPEEADQAPAPVAADTAEAEEKVTAAPADEAEHTSMPPPQHQSIATGVSGETEHREIPDGNVTRFEEAVVAPVAARALVQAAKADETVFSGDGARSGRSDTHDHPDEPPLGRHFGPRAPGEPATKADRPMTQVRNRIYEHLVEGEDDVIGLITYSLYKQDKRDWLSNWIARHGTDPTTDQVEAFIDAQMTVAQRERYRNAARQVLDAYASVAVDVEKPVIIRDAIAGRVEDAATKVERSGNWWRQLGIAVVAGVVTVAVVALLIVVLVEAGVDLAGYLGFEADAG